MFREVHPTHHLAFLVIADPEFEPEQPRVGMSFAEYKSRSCSYVLDEF